jgi:hypothetical protein
MNGDIPEQLKAQIDEFTSTGYMLFYTDSNNNAQHLLSINDDVGYYTITAYAKHVLESISELNKADFKACLEGEMRKLEQYIEGLNGNGNDEDEEYDGEDPRGDF